MESSTRPRDTPCHVDQNVEFVKGLYGAAEALDKQQLLDALPALIEQSCDPEIEWFEDPQRADSRIYRGHEGVLRSFTQWLEGFDEYGFVVEDVIDCDDDVFVAAREEERGRASGAPVRLRDLSGPHLSERQGSALPGV